MGGTGLEIQQSAPLPGSNRYKLCLSCILTLTVVLFLVNLFVYVTVVPLSTTTSEGDTNSYEGSFGYAVTQPLPQMDRNLTNISLGEVEEGGVYARSGDDAVPEEFRKALKKIGQEPAEDHKYKSQYLITKTIYPVPKVPGVRKKKIISVFNSPKWYKNPGPPPKGVNLMAQNRDFKSCAYSECEVDLEGKKMSDADLVIFFPGGLGTKQPPPRRAGQLWAMGYWESAVHYSWPNKQYYDQWKDKFNLTYYYRPDSDIFAPNNMFAWRDKDLLFSDREYVEIARQKTKSVAWWVSNCKTQSKRQEYVKEMQKYIDVDVYGKCGKLKCNKATMDDCKRMLNTTYFFYLSFENSICKGYITEKFFRMFESRTHIVPVARGGADYKSYFPQGSYIDSKDFPKARDLALYLKDLAKDEFRYAQMLREKDRLVSVGYKHDWCDICKNLHTDGFPHKSYPDIKDWTHGHNTCKPPTDIR